MILPWPQECASIGYQQRSIENLCSALRDLGVEVLIDVRQRAWSHRPEYRKTALRKRLTGVDIQYLHFKAAGNPFRPTREDKKSPEECAEEFRQHLEANPDILKAVDEAAVGKRVALFCYERDTRECHRGVLLAAAREMLPQLEILAL